MLEDGKEGTCGNYQMISTLEFVRFQAWRNIGEQPQAELSLGPCIL